MLQQLIDALIGNFQLFVGDLQFPGTKYFTVFYSLAIWQLPSSNVAEIIDIADVQHSHRSVRPEASLGNLGLGVVCIDDKQFVGIRLLGNEVPYFQHLRFQGVNVGTHHSPVSIDLEEEFFALANDRGNDPDGEGKVFAVLGCLCGVIGNFGKGVVVVRIFHILNEVVGDGILQTEVLYSLTDFDNGYSCRFLGPSCILVGCQGTYRYIQHTVIRD